MALAIKEIRTGKKIDCNRRLLLIFYGKAIKNWNYFYKNPLKIKKYILEKGKTAKPIKITLKLKQQRKP